MIGTKKENKRATGPAAPIASVDVLTSGLPVSTSVIRKWQRAGM